MTCTTKEERFWAVPVADMTPRKSSMPLRIMDFVMFTSSVETERIAVLYESLVGYLLFLENSLLYISFALCVCFSLAVH